MDRDLLAPALRLLVPELTSFARWLLASGQEADELVHEVVLRALEQAATIEDPSRLRAWLFRTTRNMRVDLLRAGAVRSRLMVLEGGLEDFEDAAVPADPAPAILDRVDVETALAKLPEIARAAVLLADLWQFSYEEVAAILDIPVGTVRSRLARARARLAQLLLTNAANRTTGR
jgi:RNA polymerase sigma-70 factor (ECF subfamily)